MISVAELSRIFKKYGELERIVHWDSGARQLAYITFCNDKDACLALTMQMREKKPKFSIILPAHTWKQPVAIKADQATLLTLNDQCLLKIFGYCNLPTVVNLWKVCKRIRTVLENNVLPRANMYTIRFEEGKSMKPLKRVHDELQCVGSHVKKLRLVEAYIDGESATNLDRFLQQCSKYLRTSVKELEIRHMPHDLFSARNLELIQPLLLKIESLRVSLMDELDINPKDLQLPKLKELNLDVYDSDRCGPNINFLRYKFPSLERANMQFRVGEEIEIFLKNHRQLKSLQIHAENIDHLTRSIAKHSKDLEELEINGICIKDNECRFLWPLRHNEMLSKLVLRDWDLEDVSAELLTVILRDLPFLKNLRSLMMTTQSFSIDPNEIINLGHQIQGLEHFCSNFDWKQTQIIKFIKEARHLKTFCITEYDSAWPTIDLFRKVARERKRLFEDDPNGFAILELIIIPDEDNPREIPSVNVISTIYLYIVPIYIIQTHKSNQINFFSFLHSVQVELDPEMTMYVKFSFLKESAEKYFDI